MSTQLHHQPDTLAQQFAEAIRLADTLFGMLCEDAWTMRPIALRHPCVFYYGHLPAFAWNQVFRYAIGRESLNAEFDDLFERGIDPPDTDELAANSAPQSWPTLISIAEYKDRVESSLLDLVRRGPNDAQVMQALYMVLEHYLMHVETFSYMLHQLPPSFKRCNGYKAVNYLERRVHNEVLEVPGGSVILGAQRGSIDFGWDNEFGELPSIVQSFAIDKYPVTNGAYMMFVESGGYSDPTWWSESGWRWIQSTNRTCPQFWIEGPDGWRFAGMFGAQPLLMSAPVWVSFVEAEAFARWKGARLITEPEYQRAAAGANGTGDFDNFQFAPAPVGSNPKGASHVGVEDLIGGGWEWTSTVFAPFLGFQAAPTYPGYSADFFDGRHYVMKGASPVTPSRLVRPSFRNWFQPHYPYVYAKFRCVYEI